MTSTAFNRLVQSTNILSTKHLLINDKLDVEDIQFKKIIIYHQGFDNFYNRVYSFCRAEVE